MKTNIDFYLDRLESIAKRLYTDEVRVSVFVSKELIKQGNEREFNRLVQEVSSLLKFKRWSCKGTERENRWDKEVAGQIIGCTTNTAKAKDVFNKLLELQKINSALRSCSIWVGAHGDVKLVWTGKKIARSIFFNGLFDTELYEFLKGRKMNLFDKLRTRNKKQMRVYFTVGSLFPVPNRVELK